MIKYVVEVTQRVAVTLDEARFDDEFMEAVNESIGFVGKDIKDFASYLAQGYAIGAAENGEFISGFGHADDLGISFEDVCDPATKVISVDEI
jgi:hypothetical protein